MNRQDLALQLGISASMVSRLAKRGMPTDSVDRADKWRRRHLEPGRIKGVRMDPITTAKRAAPASGHVSIAGAHRARELEMPVALALQRVRDLGLIAYHAITDGSYRAVEPTLRDAMRAIPPGARHLVQMPLEVWDALTASIPLNDADQVSAAEGEPDDHGGEDLDDDVMGRFWYQIALGEPDEPLYIAGLKAVD
jgi:hypothetical protein